MKFQGNTKEAGINGFQAIIRLGNSDERLGLDKIIADQKSRLDGPPASAGSRHDGIRGLEVLDCSPAWRCGSCCRRRWPPSSWITIWDRRNRPPEREGEGLGLLGMKSRAREREIPGTNSSWAGRGLLLQKKKFGTRSSWRPVWFWFGVSCWHLVSSAFCFCYSVPFGLSPKQLARALFLLWSQYYCVIAYVFFDDQSPRHPSTRILHTWTSDQLGMDSSRAEAESAILQTIPHSYELDGGKFSSGDALL